MENYQEMGPTWEKRMKTIDDLLKNGYQEIPQNQEGRYLFFSKPGENYDFLADPESNKVISKRLKEELGSTRNVWPMKKTVTNSPKEANPFGASKEDNTKLPPSPGRNYGSDKNKRTTNLL